MRILTRPFSFFTQTLRMRQLSVREPRPDTEARPQGASMFERVLRGLAALTFVLGATAAPASITCEQVSGVPPRDTTVRIVIDSPDDNTVIQPRTACGGKVIINGTYLVDAPPIQYDFYVVIDASGSTTNDSGADVNGNGIFREPADNIYQAEIQAAQDFIRAMDPAGSRVAVIRFSNTASVRQQLTPDLAAAVSTLELMKSEAPGGGTYYVNALEAVRLEMLARGDLANRQQRGVFLSDGEPTDPLAAIDAKATELAVLGMFMDTFALGALDSTALRSIASITRGTFTALSVPGDIVALLPSFVPDVPYDFDVQETTAGVDGNVVMDTTALTFMAVVNLHPGANVATLRLTAYGVPPVTVECSINVTMPEPLTPDAGPEVSACPRATAVLDGSASSSICAIPNYRWLDCNGTPLSAWSLSPTLPVEPCTLPCPAVTLEMTCEGDTCTKTATTVATCLAVAPPAPALVSSCVSQAVLTCGSADPALDATWDLDTTVDSDGDGDPRNDADATGCDVTHDFGSTGAKDVMSWLSNPATGCAISAPLGFVLTDAPPARNIDGGACPGSVVSFSCGVPQAGISYWWDFDDTVDSDSNGNPADDADATGCDAGTTWITGGLRGVTGWAQDSAECRWVIAAGIIDVSDVAVPGEASDLRVTRLGDSVTLTWTAVPGATSHRVLRGDVVPLFGAGGIYDHQADDAASRGACEVLGAPAFTDPDDVADPTAFYYLVTGISSCGGEGPTGFAWDRYQYFPRPVRLPSASCP